MKLLAAVVVLAALPAHAGPDATMTRLMEEKASMLDIGIMRMERMLGDQDGLPYGTPTVGFSFDDNEIYISRFSIETLENEAAAKTACKLWFDEIRLLGGIKRDTGQPYRDTGSGFSSYFLHDGYTTTVNGIELGSLRKDLDKKFSLRFTVFFNNEDETLMMTCTSKLLGTGFATEIE